MLASRVYRDQAGRVRIEWRVESNGESAHVAYLPDPVAGCSYMLVVEGQLAVRIGGPETGRRDRGDGSRTTRTWTAQPAVSAREEVWGSNSLHLRMAVEASGPDWRHSAKLENIDRHEPDPSFFVIPPDYAVQD